MYDAFSSLDKSRKQNERFTHEALQQNCRHVLNIASLDILHFASSIGSTSKSKDNLSFCRSPGEVDFPVICLCQPSKPKRMLPTGLHKGLAEVAEGLHLSIKYPSRHIGDVACPSTSSARSGRTSHRSRQHTRMDQ